MKDPQLHSFQDEVSRLLPMGTITASANSNNLDQGATWAPGVPNGVPVSVDLNVSAIKTSAGNETYTVKAQESDDASSWTDVSQATAISATGAMTFGIFIKRRYQRVVLALGGTAPSVTCEAFLNFMV